MYMDIASRVAEMSLATRAKVGAILVNEDNILSYGWNGTPRGDDNCCEDHHGDGTQTTKSSVLHAELNLFSKMARDGGRGSFGSTLYTTLSPCADCAKLIIQAGVKSVIFKNVYRDETGIVFLQKRGIEVSELQPDGKICSYITSAYRNFLATFQKAQVLAHWLATEYVAPAPGHKDIEGLKGALVISSELNSARVAFRVEHGVEPKTHPDNISLENLLRDLYYSDDIPCSLERLKFVLTLY